jgi:hypothetical protein
MGFNYWDGSNWKTVTTQSDNEETNYSIVNDDLLTEELNEAIENRELEKESFGIKTYTSSEWVVFQSQYASDFETFSVISAMEYEINP